MQRSEQINEIAAALSKAQGLIQGAVKGNVNPHFRSKYADLASVWDAIREPFSVNGLSVVQGLTSGDSCIHCETLLMHVSGQWISETLSIPADKNNAHGFGSAATYARRFGLQAIAGIAPVDDDGNAASGKVETIADAYTEAQPKRINPLENAMEGEEPLSPEVMDVLKELTMDLVDLIEVKKEDTKAFQKFIEANLDNSQKMVLWQLMGSAHSKTRNTLNKMIATRQSVRR
jgi:hypothetical protein